MEIIATPFKGLYEIQPKVLEDQRGYFFESYNHSLVKDVIYNKWVQDNESKSVRGVLRGLHYQTGEMIQAKLVRAVVGEIYDVAVDLRTNSSTYGRYFGTILSDVNKRQLLIPRGFAHGFLVLSEYAIFSYKCDNYYSREYEGGLLYNDPTINIQWPHMDNYILSDKDLAQPTLGNHKPFH